VLPSANFASVIAVVYRPGSAAVQQRFFDELAAVLDRLAVYQVPIYVVGDFNIRLDRTDDVNADQLRLLVDCYGLVLHDTGPTHQRGGTLDTVISHSDTGRPDRVDVVDVELSDHFMLRWDVAATRDVPPVVTVASRPWSRLDVDLLRSAISTSRLCQPDTWPADIDAMAALYNDEFGDVLDSILPVRVFTRRPRPTDPWYDR